MIKIWATQGSRAIRPIWTAEEMGLDYDCLLYTSDAADD